ncbi:MAG: hypothetical protein EXQ89_06165 [Rhodospirillaceae bacterium]|nr:hypothetical protein [Rhodospirillaceae bacterium]
MTRRGGNIDALVALGRSLLGTAAEYATDFIDRSVTHGVSLGITGLSRAGKTVLTTALAQNLLLPHEAARQRLPLFQAMQDGRIRATHHLPPRRYAAFPLTETLDALCGAEPRWPRPTTGLRELRIAIDYRPRAMLLSRIAENAKLTLDIVDYPGEWLLDLPLLGGDYAGWSAEIRGLCEAEPRAGAAAEWRASWAPLQLAWEKPDDADLRSRACDAYRRFLLRCRDPHGLTYLQPGRFLQPGDDFDESRYRFCPAPPGASAGWERGGSLGAAMRQGFESYRDNVVMPFYRDHFARLRRQIVLVDVFSALRSGPAAFEDSRLSLSRVLDNFRYGNRVLDRLLGRGRIDRVIFVATKSDHIARSQFLNLSALLRAMTMGAKATAEAQGAEAEFEIAAALKSTLHAVRQLDGQPHDVLVGVPLGERKARGVMPGILPDHLPLPADWDDGNFGFVEFEPPSLASARDNGFDNIHLGLLLQHALGDLFR